MAYQFTTTRLSDASYLKDVDDAVVAFEQSLIYYLGLPTGQTLTGRVMQADIDGNITTMLKLAAVATSTTGPGWRFRDTTTGDEFLLMTVNGELKVYENTGTQGSPTWTERNALSLTTGLWDVYSSDAFGTGCQVSGIHGDTGDLSSGGFVHWNYEDFDDNAYWSTAARDKLYFPNDGRYRIHWQLGFTVAGSFPDVAMQTSCYVNAVEKAPSRTGTGSKDDVDTSSGYTGLKVTQAYVLDGIQANDYLQIACYTENFTTLTEGSCIVERIG